MICGACGGHVDKYANGRRCRTCYNEYMRLYMASRHKTRRANAIQALGGACVDCRGTSQLEFDHADRETKSFTPIFGSCSEEKLQEELAKCVLRCKPCHQEKTSREQSVPHGGGVSGRRNCRCKLCGPLKNEYNKEFRRRSRAARKEEV